METLNRRDQIKTETLNAVFDDDLMEVLHKLGIAEDFKAGDLHCAFCEDVITWDNLHSLFPHQNEVKCTCSKPTCVKELIAFLDD